MDASAPRPRLKVALAAEEAAGARALKMLVARGQHLAAVLTKTPAIVALAVQLGLTVLALDRLAVESFATWITDSEVDLLLNVHSSLNPHPAVLKAPRLGAFNMHPGPLPAYAGFNAPSWAIAEGEECHAVTVHRMVEEMDAGPIVYEERFDVGPRDTGLTVATACIREGLPLVERLLDEAERGDLPECEQQEGGVFHWYEVPFEGKLHWELGARRVVDLVRAADYGPYPSPWGTLMTSVEGRTLGIVRASRTGESTNEPVGLVGESSEGGVLVSAGDEWVRVERVRCDGAMLEPIAALQPGALCVTSN